MAVVSGLAPDMVLLLGDYVISHVPLGRRMLPETIARCGRIRPAGIADDSTRTPGAVGAIAGVPGGGAIVAFAHDPAGFAATPQRVALLLLASHAPGGQITLPLRGPPVDASRAPLRHARGLLRENGRGIYVSTGSGTSCIPARLAAAPEIVDITVRSLGR